MPQNKVRRKGKKSRKHGRWLRKPSYKRYLAEHRWLTNKARRLARYVRRHGWNPANFPGINEEVKHLAERLLKRELR